MGSNGWSNRVCNIFPVRFKRTLINVYIINGWRTSTPVLEQPLPKKKSGLFIPFPSKTGMIISIEKRKS